MIPSPRSLAAHLVVMLLAGGCGRTTEHAEALDARGTVDGAGPGDDGARGDVPPPPPPDLMHWISGNAGDVVVTPTRGVILIGGGTDVDAAFAWQRDRIAGGDIVILRASGTDGYNGYLFDQIGGVDSVETLLVDTRALADDPYVGWTLAHAEAIFVAGGDQARYLAAWQGTAVEQSLDAAWARGAVVGGTSAGCAILGSTVYSATAGSVYSDEALADPFDVHMTFERGFLALPPLAGVVTDTHFHARDRMGRLLAFAARSVAAGWAPRTLGLGIDEGTALLVDESGRGTVVGTGNVYVIRPQTAPERCLAGAPLLWSDVPLVKLAPGDTIALPAGTSDVAARSLSARDGGLVPADPY